MLHFKLECGDAKSLEEYGINNTTVSVALAERARALYQGHAACVFPSGLAAIVTVIEAITLKVIKENPNNKFAIFMPESVYMPAERCINEGLLQAVVQVFKYKNSEESFEEQVAEATKQGRVPVMVYIESPSSNIFEIHDVSFLARRASEMCVPSVMDNTYASFMGCQPGVMGVTVVVDAWTKYPGGFGDCSSGVVVSYDLDIGNTIAQYRKTQAHGTMAPGLCLLAAHRVDSADARLKRAYDSARFLIQEFLNPMLGVAVEQILAVDLSQSNRSGLTRGNGLITVVFNQEIPKERIKKFLNKLNIFFFGESWGGHISLINETQAYGRPAVRFNIGLESPHDLLRDLKQAAPALHL